MRCLRRPHAGTLLTAQHLQRADAAAMDAADPLAGFAQQFHHPHDASGRKLLYFGGHSLGLQPKSAAGMIEQELNDWRRLGVLGHHDAARPWIPYHERAAPVLAALTGAMEGEVVAMNSLTVNLHLMMVSFFRPDGARNKVLIERSAFPSDRYAMVSQLEFHGLNAAGHLIEVEPRAGERNLRTEDLLERIEREAPRLALVLLPGVQYLSGQLLEMEILIAAARRAGAAVGIDLAHAIGNTPLRLHDWSCDFAVWCSYKYLNGGPGCVGGCFVHERHARAWELPRFAGWWGHDKTSRFQMGPQFVPTYGADGWQLSNPPILALAPLRVSLEIFRRAGMGRLREKSLRLTAYLEWLVQSQLGDVLEVVTPSDPARRGSQLSIRVLGGRERGRALFDDLVEHGIIGDWREPDVIRISPTPLYNQFADCVAFVEATRRWAQRG